MLFITAPHPVLPPSPGEGRDGGRLECKFVLVIFKTGNGNLEHCFY
jgi:hypothetical protein